MTMGLFIKSTVGDRDAWSPELYLSGYNNRDWMYLKKKICTSPLQVIT